MPRRHVCWQLNSSASKTRQQQRLPMKNDVNDARRYSVESELSDWRAEAENRKLEESGNKIALLLSHLKDLLATYIAQQEDIHNLDDAVQTHNQVFDQLTNRLQQLEQTVTTSDRLEALEIDVGSLKDGVQLQQTATQQLEQRICTAANHSSSEPRETTPKFDGQEIFCDSTKTDPFHGSASSSSSCSSTTSANTSTTHIQMGFKAIKHYFISRLCPALGNALTHVEDTLITLAELFDKAAQIIVTNKEAKNLQRSSAPGLSRDQHRPKVVVVEAATPNDQTSEAVSANEGDRLAASREGGHPGKDRGRGKPKTNTASSPGPGAAAPTLWSHYGLSEQAYKARTRFHYCLWCNNDLHDTMREKEAAAAARAVDIADQVALLRIPEANADRFQEELAAVVAALVRLRTLENLESRMTTLEQRNEELQAKVISLEQSQLPASRPPNPRSAIIPTSQANTALVPRASGTVASAGTGASSSSGSTGSSALVTVLNAGTSAQNATVLTGVQYNGPMVDKRAATLPSKYDGKADITSWISSMRSYFEVMRTPQEDRRMIMGTNTEPAVRNHIELQAVVVGYERIDLTDWLKVTPVHALEDLLLDRYRDKHAALKARLKLEALKGQTWRSSMQALEQHLTGLFTTPDLGMTDVSCVRITFDKVRTVTHELNFYVLDKCPFDAVIGLGWLKAHCLRTTWADNQFVVLDAKGNERTILLDETRDSPVTLLSANKFCRPSESEFGALVLFVPKKGGKLRMCIDYRGLNRITRKNAYPLPRIDDLLDAAGGCKVFSKIDLKSGYHQIEVDPSDQHKTAFKTRDGLYEFIVMPFSLTNAPATFQCLMDKVLRHQLNMFVVVYIDDILIISKTIKEHLKHLEEVLQVLKEAQLHLNLEKSEFGRDNVIYLGHRLSANGLEPEATKVEDIRNWPQPANVRELRSFLGLASYYRKFVPKFSVIAQPLSRLTSKNVAYAWCEKCETAFQALKEALVSHHVLRIADPNLTFVVTTDASQFGIGAVLQQDDGDGLRPLEYYSKRMPSHKGPGAGNKMARWLSPPTYTSGPQMPVDVKDGVSVVLPEDGAWTDLEPAYQTLMLEGEDAFLWIETVWANVSLTRLSPSLMDLEFRGTVEARGRVYLSQDGENAMVVELAFGNAPDELFRKAEVEVVWAAYQRREMEMERVDMRVELGDRGNMRWPVRTMRCVLPPFLVDAVFGIRSRLVRMYQSMTNLGLYQCARQDFFRLSVEMGPFEGNWADELAEILSCLSMDNIYVSSPVHWGIVYRNVAIGQTFLEGVKELLYDEEDDFSDEDEDEEIEDWDF
ncbi:hypothetical protein CBR_g44598 [Chara braunii]|uniref:Reverse transcriptase domain-containing protein n=1 Tax=Chara braunii TaxID=69332 RepID=A0A388LY09_CHABU|nr:hypothetical protein CBR_g44598 [Chara braunii]|eukprot:GBG87141.1 hypothetical protein CBR_g44598 [Chara braunii]